MFPCFKFYKLNTLKVYNTTTTRAEIKNVLLFFFYLIPNFKLKMQIVVFNIFK